MNHRINCLLLFMKYILFPKPCRLWNVYIHLFNKPKKKRIEQNKMSVPLTSLTSIVVSWSAPWTYVSFALYGIGMLALVIKVARLWRAFEFGYLFSDRAKYNREISHGNKVGHSGNVRRAYY